MEMLRRATIVALTASVAVIAVAGGTGAKTRHVAAPALSSAVTYVNGSTRKVCQLTGETDNETGKPTASRTASRFGLSAADHGYSFSYQGKLWFLFGDGEPTKTFNGQPNDKRWSNDKSSIVNDAIAYASGKGADGCPILDFIPQTSPAVGAFTNPTLIFNGQAVNLRTNESPNSGVEVNGRMYVIFVTDNPTDTCTPKTCPHALGYPTKSILAVLKDAKTLQFEGLYDLSAPSGRFGAGARFINVAIASAPDGWLYLWGTEGGSAYRHSLVYLARIKPADLGRASSGGGPAAIEYYSGHGPKNKPTWTPQSESAAAALFHDSPPCMGELAVEFNPYVDRWVMLYNCLNNTSANPRGISMRTARHMWGPWSTAQTIFNPITDHGYCYFIHAPGKCAANLPNPPKHATRPGGDYGPYFLSGWTTGTRATATVPATSTFYYTLDTFVPYGQVIMKSEIEGSPIHTVPPHHLPSPPPCRPGKPGSPITCK